MSRDVLSIACRNQLSEIARVSEAIAAFAEAHAVPMDVAFKLDLALDELLTNVISYGYDDTGEHEIDVRVSLDADAIVVRVEDDGRAYNPLDTPPPDLTADLDQRPIGGLGVHLVRSTMDGVEYRRENGRNILTLRKRITGESASTGTSNPAE